MLSIYAFESKREPALLPKLPLPHKHPAARPSNNGCRYPTIEQKGINNQPLQLEQGYNYQSKHNKLSFFCLNTKPQYDEIKEVR